MISKENTNVANQQAAGIGKPIPMPSTARNTGEQHSSWERPALAGGIIAAALQIAATALFIAFIVPTLPPIDAPAAQFAAFAVEQSQNAIYGLISYLIEAQMLFLVLFFGGLFGVLRRAEGGSGSLATVVFGAGIAMVVITPLAAMIENHLLFGLATGGADPVAVQAVDGLVPLSLALSGFPRAVVLGGIATLLLSHRFAPRWVGWLGFILGVFSLIGTGTLMIADLFPLTVLGSLLFAIWILVLSVALLRSSRTVSHPAPQSALA